VSGLRSRILFGVPLAIVAVWAAVAGGWWFALLAAAAAVVGLHELYSMARETRPLTLAGLPAAGLMVVAVHAGGPAWMVVPLAGALLVAFWLSAVADVHQRPIVQLSTTLFGVVWVGVGAACLVALRDVEPDDWGRDLLLATLIGVWTSDIAAYFGGRLFGRRRLAPAISPNKTREGFAIGLVAGTAAAFFWLYDQPPGDPVEPAQALALALAVALASPIGDLFESYVKRDAGVKDSGRLLGGHGGVLDRVDALLFAGVAAYAVTLALGRA
jgi:phosphatidate cytidylyltransferase